MTVIFTVAYISCSSRFNMSEGHFMGPSMFACSVFRNSDLRSRCKNNKNATMISVDISATTTWVVWREERLWNAGERRDALESIREYKHLCQVAQKSLRDKAA